MSTTQIIFGDVHGQGDQLERFLTTAISWYGSTVQFVTLGDLIDRGPSVPKVLDLCIEHNVTGIYGNHETWIKSVLAGSDLPSGVKASIMGGIPTIESYGVSAADYPSKVGHNLRKRVPKKHAAFLSSLTLTRVLTHTTPTGAQKPYFLTHAGINHTLVAPLLQRLAGANQPLSDRMVLDVLARVAAQELLWSSPDVFSSYQGAQSMGLFRFIDAVQVFGHRPMQKPVAEPDWFYAMDTGCGTCAPKLLSGLVLVDGEEPVTMSVR